MNSYGGTHAVVIVKRLIIGGSTYEYCHVTIKH